MSTPAKGTPETGPEEKENEANSSSSPTERGEKGESTDKGEKGEKTNGEKGEKGEEPNVKRELIRRQTVLAVPKLNDRTSSFRSRSNSNPLAPTGDQIMNNERALELIFEELMVSKSIFHIYTLFSPWLQGDQIMDNNFL
jgi:hypothetical protein